MAEVRHHSWKRDEQRLRDLPVGETWAASRATRRSLAVNASTPVMRARRGFAPVMSSSARACSATAFPPQRSARSSASRSVCWASRRLPLRLSAAPSSASARACSSLAGDCSRWPTASRRYWMPSLPPSITPAARSEIPTVAWAPAARRLKLVGEELVGLRAPTRAGERDRRGAATVRAGGGLRHPEARRAARIQRGDR